VLEGEGGTGDLTAEEQGLVESARQRHEARLELRQQQLRRQYASAAGAPGGERPEKQSRHIDLLVSAVLHKVCSHLATSFATKQYCRQFKYTTIRDCLLRC
jgi:hypothetical protein